jgi:uncharacterized secreted protein with C-terminal beta-propeller domain
MFKKLVLMFLVFAMLLSSFSVALAAEKPEIETIPVTQSLKYTIYFLGTHDGTYWCCGGYVSTSSSYYAYLKIGSRTASGNGTVSLSAQTTYQNYGVVAQAYTNSSTKTAANGTLVIYG